MNRAQRRSKLPKLEQEVLLALFDANKETKDTNLLPEGTKVKLNYELIASRPDYERALIGWHDFVELHKDDEFTVEYDSKHQKDPYLVCFKEDNSPMKWLFLITDLIKVREK